VTLHKNRETYSQAQFIYFSVEQPGVLFLIIDFHKELSFGNF